jgi:hypothetical protein
VGDEPAFVAQNRAILSRAIGGIAIQWLNQVHGTRIVQADCGAPVSVPDADGAWTMERDLALAVLTADCLPVVLTDRSFQRVALVHGGWRGLVGGILSGTCALFGAAELIAWIGPGIGPAAYEVGGDVLQAVTELGPFGEDCIRRTRPGKGYLDLFQLAERQLEALGVAEIYCERLCTASTAALYSHRRDGVTGRMATLASLSG